MRILVTGTRSKAYPESGVRLAFDRVQLVVADLATGQPVVIVHGEYKSGVDGMADRLAPEYGWTTERHPTDWPRCSPLCETAPKDHRRTKFGGTYSYCPNADFWCNQQMVDLQNNPNYGPYRMCLALPNGSWTRSPGTYDCYKRAKAAGIKTLALNFKGELFINPNTKAGTRK